MREVDGRSLENCLERKRDRERERERDASGMRMLM